MVDVIGLGKQKFDFMDKQDNVYPSMACWPFGFFEEAYAEYIFLLHAFCEWDFCK